jgi:iron complex transport system substrate-binding protein
MRRLLTIALAGSLALTAACGGSDDDAADADSAGGSGSGAASGEWTFTDDNGNTVTLVAPPETVVAQSTIAGGLWEYGVDVAGVFGPLRRADGEPDPAIGLADPDDFESLGEVDSEINIEALAALQPDIIVAPAWSEETYWGIAPDAVDELAQIAPIVAIRVDDRPMDEPLARVGELAASFGDDVAAEVESARGEFDDASQGLSDAVAAKPGLTVLAASGTLQEFYVAWPPGFPDLNYYGSLGMQLVEPTEHPEANGYWQKLSWEQVDTYPADLILSDVRGATLEDQIAQMPPTAQDLPAVQADQMIAWPAASALGYGNAAAVLASLTESVDAADENVV